MGKIILGLDLGSNSVGWALLEANNDGEPIGIIDCGSRIFNKAVEDKTPTPKNQARRQARLARRVLQRRARRKQRMLNYLVSLNLLPKELQGNYQPEIVLNPLGNPYELRAKALDHRLAPFELGRVFLHLVQRRGFLSNRKTLLGDLVDDPDVAAVLEDAEFADEKANKNSEETAFKKDITALRETIISAGKRTLGEYLASLPVHANKRNRAINGGHLRTDRQMYRDELELIWAQQAKHHKVLTEAVREQIEHIIFHQRPLKLRPDRVGKCSLEPKNNRAKWAWMEAQRFRYLQDINHLTYFDPYHEKDFPVSEKDRPKVVELFEQNEVVKIKPLKGAMGLSGSHTFNLERGNKKLKGNTTACAIREVYPEWDALDEEQQSLLVEDLITMQKKSALKKRLIGHWKLPLETAVKLCMVGLEPDHASLSLKAIGKLLPYLEQGMIISDARQAAGYGWYEPDAEQEDEAIFDRLPAPPELTNPIVNKGLHEVRRVVNAIIATYGKPDSIRVEMARDLEMNTKRYKEFTRQQNKNTKANDEAVEKYRQMGVKNPHLGLSHYPSRDDKLKYRIWKDQGERCAYSGEKIGQTTLFSPEIDVDHILPYSQSLDDSYMNKVVCYAAENRFKGQRTPIDAFGGNEAKWQQITGAISRWDKSLRSKVARFYMTDEDVQARDFAASQLNDTRYISREALKYLKCLGSDVSVTKGFLVSWLRHQWGLNDLLGETDKKERSDHRHHTIDAVVIACVDRGFHRKLSSLAKKVEAESPEFKVKDLHIDPPWAGIRADLDTALDEVIVSHDPQRKISGALHEDTGAGFREGEGTIYRKTPMDYFGDCKDEKKATKKLSAVIDGSVRELLHAHMRQYGFAGKTAFSEDKAVFHKDGKTPIKRVRIYQSQQIRKQSQLERQKFGVKNQQGEIFKWYSYGNIHHVEVFRATNNKVFGVFVTMMEAHRRAMTTTKSARKRGINPEAIIGKQYPKADFLFAIHRDDTVSIQRDGKIDYFRVKALGQLSQGKQPRPTLVHHTAADKAPATLSDSIQNLFTKYKIMPVNTNVLGKPHDQTHRRDQ